jgi:Fe-S cluster biogenesis protein NfuA/nitrite reductase/ring-hydroxylating ferredoxin subunit
MTIEADKASEQQQTEFEKLAKKVDAAATEVRKLSQEDRAKALALQSAIEEFHKYGLTKIVKHLKADPRGKELLFELIDEPSVYALFAMHGIVRPDITTRVRQVLDGVRPYMESHGGDVELVEVKQDTVFLRLHGSCNGCSASAVTLRNGVEEALKEQVPEITRIEVVPNEPSPVIIPLTSLKKKSTGWTRGPALDDIPEGKPYRFDSGEVSLIIVKLDTRLNVFKNECAHQGLPLDGGRIDKEACVLTCPWHGFRYDALSGECLTAPQAQLESVPQRVEDGYLWLRLK